ncbi:prohead assembly protein [Aeromonas phage avDM5]|uniref:Prohead assembly protein n=1 Tax=Aeromonas phage vB_AehM_DM2 TaxID=2973716 RepID=A0AA94YU63_9CAUD|nr:prohead assembly protein [Aeromonas phage avDM5]UYD60557.1 prohead assembly protein [Aeromonas phage avDM2]UYD60607.1 prohead assembly protein [Aeromonas phage avDM2]
MLIPSDYIAEAVKIEAAMADATFRVNHLVESGFATDEIVGVISRVAASEPDMAIAMISVVESTSIDEAIVKHVNSRGEITRTKDRATRKRNAFATTGLTASTRRQIARRAAKTKRANPSINVKAQRKTKRALKRRKALGL